MANYKVAFLDVFPEATLAEVKAQVPAGFELLTARSSDERDLVDILADADFILTSAVPLTARLMDAAPKVKLIQKWGIGVDRIDLQATAQRGIPVAITAGANAVPVAEHAVMLMLAVLRKLPYVDRSLRGGRWLKNEIRSESFLLSGKTVGLVGMGNIGREVAKRVRAFNCPVIYFDKVRASAGLEEQLPLRFLPLDDLLAQADIISLHVPSTPETQGMIDERAISLMKRSAILINTARGKIVDELALARALASGRIAGAGIDAFVKEPPDLDNPLLRLDNVVLTPHSAGGVFDNAANVARHAFRNMVLVANGQDLKASDLVRWEPE